MDSSVHSASRENRLRNERLDAEGGRWRSASVLSEVRPERKSNGRSPAWSPAAENVWCALSNGDKLR